MSGAATFLAHVVGALERAQVPYMLTGSFASSYHGAPRATQDIDIVVDPTFDSLELLLNALADDDIYLDFDVARDEFKRRGQFNVIDGMTAWKVDVIFRKARAFSTEEISRRLPAEVLGVELYVATAEDTVLAKLEWAKLGESERQLRDVRALLEAIGESLDRTYIEAWVDALGVRDLWERTQGE